MEKQKIIDEQNRLVDQIKEYVPLIKPFFDENRSLREYSESLYDFEAPQEHQTRQKLVKEIIENKFKTLFPNEDLQVSLDKSLALNIVDHHQFLNHPLLIASTFINSTNKIFKPEKQNATVVVSSGDVPPNNYFTKSGFQLNGKKVPLFSVSEKEYTTYFIPKREFNFIERLRESKQWSSFTEAEKSFLLNEQDVISSYDFGTSTDYKDQISIVVKKTWPRFFKPRDRETLPELLYITQEELAKKCLITLLKKENFLSEVITNPVFTKQVLDNFRGIVTTWNEAEKKGTHFFWMKHPDSPKSLRLWWKDGYLVPDDSRFVDMKFKFDIETVIGLLEKDEIYPSLFFIFSVLHFFAGVKPLVGHGSVVYLQLFKEAWIKSFQNSKYEAEIELISSIKTDGMTMGPLIHFGRHEGELKSLFAYDIFMRDGLEKEYYTSVFQKKFNELLAVSVVDMYAYLSQKYIPNEDRIKTSITTDDLVELAFDWVK